MLVTAKYFGMVLEHTQTNQETITLPKEVCTLQDFEHFVLQQYPKLKTITYVIAKNQKISSQKDRLNNGDELAFLPPFAGG